ncbi:MAG TPA: DUF5715 family protein [Pyrinomonadaceae bacterium]
MKLRKSSLIFLTGNSIFFVIVAILLVAPVWRQRGHGSLRSLASMLPTTARAAEVNPWTLAVEKVKEDRGEPVGKQAKIETPAQLRHYSDTRRFLATQVAEVRQHHIQNPQDFVDLAALISAGEMVPLQPVTENYILFGVGGNADNEPFARYENGKSINLYNEAGLRQEYAGLAESRAKFASELGGLLKELSALSKRDRSRRAKLRDQIAAAEKSLKADDANKAMLDRYYGNAQKQRQLFGYYESLESFGKNLPGQAFDIQDAAARRDFKVRLLSSLRPEALQVLEEIAVSYREKFNRPLPITSLVRPDEYQHQLGKTNPNATRIETPPHSTGLAFDILYRFMTAAEQSHVMAHLSQLKDAGRIEVLRENRDHYHVFAFVDGARPNESLIMASLGDARAPQLRKEAHHAEKPAPKKSNKTSSTRSKRRR